MGFLSFPITPLTELRKASMIRPPVFVVCLAASLVLPASAAHATGVEGRVIETETGDPLYLVDVMLEGTGHRATTDHAGRFILSDVAAGTYTVRASRLGYEEVRREGVRIGPDETPPIEISMDRRSRPLEEVTVTPGAFSFMGTGTAGRQTMTREQIESVPQLGEDVFRAVNRLPGLSSGDYSAHFSIRGGRHDETLILMDGLEIYEPYHLKDFDEGAISIIDTETIDGIELMTGGFPAQYGNKRSGVFSIASRSPALDRTHYSLGISFLKARALAMGPLWNGRGSWIVSGRSGYMDLVFKLINQDDLPSPRYHDVFAKMQVDLNANHALSFDVLHAGDKYTFDAASTTGFQDMFDSREFAENRYGNSYVWSTLESALGARTLVRTMGSAGLVKRQRDGSETYVDSGEPIYQIFNERDFSILGAKQDWTVGVADPYVLTFGADFRYFDMSDTSRSVIDQDPNDPSACPDSTCIYPVITDASIAEAGGQLGLYFSNRFRLAEPLTLDVGGRYDRAAWTGDSDFSPRIGAALDVGSGRTLRGAWGHYRQIQGIDDVSTLDETQIYYRSELSEQFTVGVEQVFANGAFLRVEAYYKEGSDLRPVYRNWKGGVDTFPETNEDRILVFPTKMTSQGIEVYFDHELGPRSAIRASYAYSEADEEVDRIENVNGPDDLVYDRTHPNPMDQRHAANVDFTYRLRRVWSVTGSLAFHTGWPATEEELVEVVDDEGNPDFVVRPQKLYGVRLPSYLRLDVRATRRWSTSSGDWRFFVELVNLTNHSNVFGWDYFKELDQNGQIVLQRDEETWFTILPSVGVSWSTGF